MIQLFNVSKFYGRASPALDGVSLTIHKGDFIYLTGPSGAGKTTLLKILFRRERIDRGQVLVHGFNVGKLSESRLYQLRRKIGVVFQDYKLLPNKTAFQNVAFAQEVIGGDDKIAKTETWKALKEVGLTQKRNAYPPELSGGEQQRVAIARALVNHPSILLADEPTGNLDPAMAAEILDLFEQANRRGVTVVLATHNQELLKAGRHPVITLHRGRVVEH